MTGDLCDLSLIEAADGIRCKRFSATELTAACIARAEQLQAPLNTFIHLEAELAMDAARAADGALARGEGIGPLHGVPLAHKDTYYRAGRIATCGSRIRRDFVPDRTATTLRRLDAAGAIDLGGLNTSDSGLNPFGLNILTGRARNPWNPDHVTGGSSSGSAAAVAARLVFGSLGSDSGGSVRLPAALCGVVGLKPTERRVSRYGIMPLSFTLDSPGPLTRTVADCARLLAVIAGGDPARSEHQPGAGAGLQTHALAEHRRAADRHPFELLRRRRRPGSERCGAPGRRDVARPRGPAGRDRGSGPDAARGPGQRHHLR